MKERVVGEPTDEPVATVVPLPRLAHCRPLRQQVAVAIMRARQLSRYQPASFASALRHEMRVGNFPSEEDVLAWERGERSPSAEDLLAAAEVAGVEVELLLGRRAVLSRLRDLEDQVEAHARALGHLQRFTPSPTSQLS